MESNLKKLHRELCKKLNLKPTYRDSGCYENYEGYSIWYRAKASYNGESILISPPRGNNLFDIISIDTKDIPAKILEIVEAIEKNRAKRLKDKLKREENRPLDELTIIAKALDEAKIPYIRYGTELRFDFVFEVKIKFYKEEKEMTLKFGKGDYYWEQKIEGNLQDPNSKLLDNILKIVQHAVDLDGIANEITIKDE